MNGNPSVVESFFGGDPLQTSLGLIAIFLACPAVLMKLIPRIPVLRKVSFVPFLYLVPMVLASLEIIPASHPLYDPLQSLTLYMAIFFMVLAIDLHRILRSLETRILLLFLLGCLGVALGGTVAYGLFAPVISAESAAMVAACNTAAYSGGAMNWVAVSEAIDVPSSLSASAFPGMIIVYALYLGVVLALGNSPLRPVLERWIGATGRSDTPAIGGPPPAEPAPAASPRLEDYIYGFLAFCIVYLASVLLEQSVRGFFFVPAVIFLTTFAILIGAVAPRMKSAGMNRMGSMSTFGEAALYFLLCVIGAQASLTGSLIEAPVLLLIPTVIITVHALVLLLAARLLKVDLVTSVVASVSAVGGAASAPVTAAALGSAELIPLGVILSSLGYALGTYLGVYLGLFLLSL